MPNEDFLHADDHLLIDARLGELDESERADLESRLNQDSELATRARKVDGLFRLLDACDAPSPDEQLIQKTVASAMAAARTSALLDIEQAKSRPISTSTFSFKELGAIAALFFVVASVLVPSLSSARRHAIDLTCVGQAGQVGTGLTLHANDHDRRLPSLSHHDAAWLPSAKASVRRSNSQNLWQLARDGYVKPTLFQCPAGGDTKDVESETMSLLGDFPGREFIGYSYLNGVNAPPMRLDSPRPGATAVLADATPVFRGGVFHPENVKCMKSFNHDERGQAVLYLDMHAVWATCATVGADGDNIWLLRDTWTYSGVEKPNSTTDSFMLPNFIAGTQ